jgi:NAD(P)-dependent dehydrogenase (short-subunit alcohol dehydrogenase family)
VPERGSAGRLRGKVALVTGASRGIGLAIAKALAVEGCHLVITSTNHNNLQKAEREVAKLAQRVLSKPCSVSDEKAVEALFAALRREFGKLDVLVNNAGISHSMAPVAKLDARVWMEVLATNLTGMFLVTRSALALMGPGGTIVNNLSVAARGVFAGESAYCASKHGALGFTNTLREEIREKGIRVIALMPGPTDTDIWKQFWPEAPRSKMMRPETVAAAVVSALVLPTNSTVEELTVAPTAGGL